MDRFLIISIVCWVLFTASAIDILLSLKNKKPVRWAVPGLMLGVWVASWGVFLVGDYEVRDQLCMLSLMLWTLIGILWKPKRKLIS
jgi:hypothetical protein